MFGDHVGEITSIIFMSFALSMDAFSISLGMGMQRLRLKRIAIIGITFGIFHIIFPFIGIIVGTVLSAKIGQYATLAGGLLLVFIGLQMFFSAFIDVDKKRMIEPYGIGLFLLAFSVSIDSFPVGLSLGISGAKTALVIALFGINSTLLTWIGHLVARRVRGLFGVYSEILGGSILLTFGLKVMFDASFL